MLRSYEKVGRARYLSGVPKGGNPAAKRSIAGLPVVAKTGITVTLTKIITIWENPQDGRH